VYSGGKLFQKLLERDIAPAVAYAVTNTRTFLNNRSQLYETDEQEFKYSPGGDANMYQYAVISFKRFKEICTGDHSRDFSDPVMYNEMLESNSTYPQTVSNLGS
jgi:hypothetical protein